MKRPYSIVARAARSNSPNAPNNIPVKREPDESAASVCAWRETEIDMSDSAHRGCGG